MWQSQGMCPSTVIQWLTQPNHWQSQLDCCPRPSNTPINNTQIWFGSQHRQIDHIVVATMLWRGKGFGWNVICQLILGSQNGLWLILLTTKYATTKVGSNALKLQRKVKFQTTMLLVFLICFLLPRSLHQLGLLRGLPGLLFWSLS